MGLFIVYCIMFTFLSNLIITGNRKIRSFVLKWKRQTLNLWYAIGKLLGTYSVIEVCLDANQNLTNQPLGRNSS
jgi:hypothetical protein